MASETNRPIVIHREGAFRTMMISALGWGCFFFVAALVSTAFTDQQKRQVAKEAALNNAVRIYTLSLASAGFLGGLLLTCAVVVLARTRSDLNDPLPDSSFTRGQFAVWILVNLAALPAGLLLMLYLAPLVASELVLLRNPRELASIGGVAGILGGNLIHGTLFHLCRR